MIKTFKVLTTTTVNSNEKKGGKGGKEKRSQYQNVQKEKLGEIAEHLRTVQCEKCLKSPVVKKISLGDLRENNF